MEDWHEAGRAIWTAAAWFGAAILGRVMFVLREVKAGSRQLWSTKTMLDLGMAAPMGLIAHGLCAWLGVTGAAEAALVAVAGYLGPNIIDRFVDKKLRGE